MITTVKSSLNTSLDTNYRSRCAIITCLDCLPPLQFSSDQMLEHFTSHSHTLQIKCFLCFCFSEIGYQCIPRAFQFSPLYKSYPLCLSSYVILSLILSLNRKLSLPYKQTSNVNKTFGGCTVDVVCDYQKIITPSAIKAHKRQVHQMNSCIANRCSRILTIQLTTFYLLLY